MWSLKVIGLKLCTQCEARWTGERTDEQKHASTHSLTYGRIAISPATLLREDYHPMTSKLGTLTIVPGEHDANYSFRQSDEVSEKKNQKFLPTVATLRFAAVRASTDWASRVWWKVYFKSDLYTYIYFRYQYNVGISSMYDKVERILPSRVLHCVTNWNWNISILDKYRRDADVLCVC